MIKLISAIHPYMNKNLAIYTLFSLYIDPPSRYLFKENRKKITKNFKSTYCELVKSPLFGVFDALGALQN